MHAGRVSKKARQHRMNLKLIVYLYVNCIMSNSKLHIILLIMHCHYIWTGPIMHRHIHVPDIAHSFIPAHAQDLHGMIPWYGLTIVMEGLADDYSFGFITQQTVRLVTPGMSNWVLSSVGSLHNHIYFVNKTLCSKINSLTYSETRCL